MSPVFMVFVLVAASLCLSGVCSDRCLKPLPDQMVSRNECLRGYYKLQGCNNSMVLCAKCKTDTFTDMNNNLRYCLPCHVCNTDEIAKSECTHNKNRECVCKDGLYRFALGTSLHGCQNCTKCTNCSNCPECKGKCGVQNCGHGQFLDKMGKCQSCVDHNCSDKSCKSFCKPVLEPITPLILALKVSLSILVLLALCAFCYFIWKTCLRTQLCCWAHTKNANERRAVHNEVPPNMPTLLDQPGEQLNIPMSSNENPGSAVKETGTRDKERPEDLDWTGQITAPLIINGDIKGIVTIFYNYVFGDS